MNFISTKSLLASNLTLKIISLFFGFCWWSLLNQSQLVDVSINVPVRVIHVQENQTIEAPETVMVALRASRTDVAALDITTLSIYIDGHALHAGKNEIIITKNLLLLPPCVSMLHCNPRMIEIIVS
jgi:hypothetical protein